MVIIPPGATLIMALDSDSGLAFILEVFSEVFIGGGGGGEPTGIIARSIIIITFSIVTVTADADTLATGPTILTIGKEWAIRIVRSTSVTAAVHRQEEHPIIRDLVGNHIRPGSTTRYPEPMLPQPATGVILTSQASPAKVRNAAIDRYQPITETADTERVRPTVETVLFPAFNPARPIVAATDTAGVLPTAETVLFPAFNPARPIVAAMDTARVLPTAEATGGIVLFPVIAPAHPMAAATDTARVLPMAEATGGTVLFPVIVPARPMAAADTTPAPLLAAGAQSALAAVFTVDAVVNYEFSHVLVWGPKHRTSGLLLCSSLLN